MIDQLKRLLPDFEISKEFGIFYAKRLLPNNGGKLIVPLIITRDDDLEDIASMVKEAWERNNA